MQSVQGQSPDQLAAVNAMIKERDDEIRGIYADIKDVNKLMQEISTAIDRQGRIVDNIEGNIIDTRQNVNAGLRSVEKAEAEQNLCILH